MYVIHCNSQPLIKRHNNVSRQVHAWWWNTIYNISTSRQVERSLDYRITAESIKFRVGSFSTNLNYIIKVFSFYFSPTWTKILQRPNFTFKSDSFHPRHVPANSGVERVSRTIIEHRTFLMVHESCRSGIRWTHIAHRACGKSDFRPLDARPSAPPV